MKDILICLTHELPTMSLDRCSRWSQHNCEVVPRLLVDPEGPSIIISEHRLGDGIVQISARDELDGGSPRKTGRYYFGGTE